MKMIIRDLISDVRCAIRDKKPEYADECRRNIALTFPLRNTGRQELDRYGWPKILK
jgi:hypothetical protein